MKIKQLKWELIAELINYKVFVADTSIGNFRILWFGPQHHSLKNEKEVSYIYHDENGDGDAKWESGAIDGSTENAKQIAQDYFEKIVSDCLENV